MGRCGVIIYMKRWIWALALLLLLPSQGMSQANCLDSLDIALIPSPRECRVADGTLHKLRQVAADSSRRTTLGADEYGITIRRGKAVVWGNLHWAMSTLEQLKDSRGRVPDVEIHDWAAYPFRAFMHDVGRNFQTLDMLKETLDLMCRYKLNVFHWHLTDYPAWRIECCCHPELNDPQYQRAGRDEGKFYTYNEIRELIAYAAERGITVMPEIDMPGHSTYFANAFGCTMDSEDGKKILKECLEEFFGEVPPTLCPYLHVGGDEIWIADPEGFARWVQELVHNAGYTPMAWDPGLPTMPYTVRQLWNEAAAANSPEAGSQQGRYVDSFVGYLNYYDPTMFAMRAFMHKACAQEVPDTTVALGGILCLWNDVRVADKSRIALHNGMLQGMMAFAERFWQGGSGGEAMPHENLYPRRGTTAYDNYKAMERRMAQHKERYYGEQMRWAPNADIAWRIMLGDTVVEAQGGYIDLDALCQAYRRNADSIAQVIAECVIENDGKKSREMDVLMGFDVPARSDRLAAGIGEQGRWENDARVYLITPSSAPGGHDTVELCPPASWQEPGAYQYHYHTWHKPEAEQPYTDEQFYWMRQPVRITVPPSRDGGESVIRIVQPHGFVGQRWGMAIIINN